MAIAPIDHYRLYEEVPTSIAAVRAFIDDVEQAGRRLNADVYWRGQTTHTWGVTSSLSRLSDAPTGLTDAELREAEATLLKEARRWVTSLTSPPANDLEWLALLQHMSVPTRLIDFTPDPLIATFFASETHDEVEGRLFAILVPRENPVLIDAETLEIDAIPQGDVRLWKPPAEISPRVAAQQGVFVLAKLPSTAPRRVVWDEQVKGSRQMLRSEVVSMMSVPLAFSNLTNLQPLSTKGVRCYTAKIHVDKAALREQLAKRATKGALRPAGEAIDYAYCYPDVEGMLRYSKVLNRVQRGL